MRIQKHPNLPLWCREDGAICMPPDGHRFFKFRWTFGSPDKEGYLRIRFRGKQYKVHRLICGTFHGLTPKDGLTVDHYPDRNPSNNRADNLRWADYKMQQGNTQRVDESLARYGVRECEDPKAYWAAYNAKQQALGKKRCTCPDGKLRWLTDSEFSAMFG